MIPSVVDGARAVLAELERSELRPGLDRPGLAKRPAAPEPAPQTRARRALVSAARAVQLLRSAQPDEAAAMEALEHALAELGEP